MQNALMEQDIEDLHHRACESGLPTYIDPLTGYQVFTARALRARGKCCGCGCRHCAEAFPLTGLAAARARGEAHVPPVFLHGSEDDLDDEITILFWSGGKDSYLALREIARQTTSRRCVLLLTTYDARTEIVAHQEVGVAVVKRQANALDLPLLGVPLCGAAGNYVWHVKKALYFITRSGIRVGRLAFGDLHLAHVKEWRDANLGDVVENIDAHGNSVTGPSLWYPLWQRNYADLREDLRESRVVARICSVPRDDLCKDSLRVGDVFDDHLIRRLPEGVDEFGEDGEFHTVVEVWANSSCELPWRK